MKRFSKVLASLMVPAMAISITGCKSSKTASSDDSKLTKSVDNLKKDSKTGLPILPDHNDPVTFKVFIRDPSQAPAKNNPVLKKIKELTGVTIDYEFLVGDLTQKEGVMIAGEDYPDAVFGEAPKFISAGAFIPLENKLPKYKNLNALYSPYKKYMTAQDGHEYILELYMSQKASPIFENTGSGFWLQKDVLKEGGYKVPKTLDDYFNLIEAYKAKHPTVEGGVKSVGFEVLCDGWRDYCLRNPAQNLLGDGDATIDYSKNTAYFYQTSDTAKNYYKKLNEEYNKGIIQSESFTENYDQYSSRISSGAVLGMYDQQWNFLSAQNTLKNDGKNKRTYVSVPIANPGTKDGYLDAPNGTIDGINGIGITKKCKDPDRLLEFYNWMLDRNVQDYLQWGVEGKDWKKAGSNDKVLTAERRAINNDTAKKRDLTGNTLWNYSPKWQGLYSDGTPCGPDNSVAEYKASQSPYDKKFLSDLKIDYPAQLLSAPVKRPSYYPIWGMTIKDGSAAKVADTALNDVTRKFYPRLIMAKPSQYDSMWNQFLDAFNKSNPKPYLDEVNKQIKDKMNQ